MRFSNLINHACDTDVKICSLIESIYDLFSKCRPGAVDACPAEYL